ncbi:Oxysterol-binding protein-related protein 1 [Nibea albiflora]|uniref:Oxysterol-binding protein-related protein 1 n=1 Tax=Nibea albiflora TaxID=240163 RepID=A0ACB7FJG6_NIBAL|nr:Oxysterol-binding protein-related protein 1 [Nibea albiflora]
MEADTLEEQLLLCAKTGSCPHIQRLLQSRIHQDTSLDINCRFGRFQPVYCVYNMDHICLQAGADVNVQNNLGDTPLHKAAYTGRKEIVLLLLRYDACSNIINGTAQIPKDVTEDDEIITMLEAAERRETRRREEQLLEAAREGDVSALSKILSGKEAPDVHCRDSVGNTPLHCAAYRGQKQCIIKLLKSGASPCIKNSNDQTALDLARSDELRLILAAYQVKVRTDRVKPWDHCFFMLRCFDDTVHCFKVPSKTDSVSTRKKQINTFVSIKPSVNHKSTDKTFYNVNMLDHLSSVWWPCLQVWSLKLEQEVEKNKALTEALQTLATEHHELKQSLCKNRRSSTLSTLTEDDFYDAVSESDSELSVSGFLSVASHSCEEDEGRDAPLLSSLRHPNALRGPTGMSGEGDHGNQPAQYNGVKQHRTCLPAPMFSRNDVSIWSILKKCIGMELSKIAMPVIFNEPLSFLQRLTEYMEHTYLIHQANATTDSVERMKCVAAFAVSAVASQWERTGKPFNPLLGETYELIRDDLGFRWVSEQVSHHPPVSAFQAEGLKEDFIFHGSIYPKLKFWGKSIEAEPKGVITLELPKYNEAYTWTNPTCCVHNIIVGQLWIEQYGSVEVINHKTGERCSMSFKPCGLFGKELHKVEGYILDKSKKKLCAIYGKWTECLYTVDAATFDNHKKTDRKNSDEKKGNKQVFGQEEIPLPDAETVEVIPGSELIWKITPRPENSAKFYAFSTFAMHLNELETSMEGVVPTTDSRLRPDIRAMENGDIDLASAEKKRLEEKQRIARKNRTKSTDEWKTRWFQQGPNPHNKAQDWLYSKGYWDRNYTNMPDIY